MNKGILGFKVFRRRKPACKVVAVLSAFAMLIVGAFPALAAGYSGPVLDNVNGGASIAQSTDNVTKLGDGMSATLSLLGGKSGLIDWSALNIGSGQSLNFQGGNFYNVVQGGSASQIAGTLKASGSLWIFNPAGISFINGAQVDVNGVFSAAAAGLANHDEMFQAINDSYAALGADPETATWDVPAAKFGAPEGNISVEAGTAFNGNVSLLGKQVSVSEGATFSGDLTVTAAAGQTDVDEVEGGKVSVSINDFADVDSDINVTFEAATGEFAGQPLKVGGDLNVIADGSIYVQGAIKADGDIAFKTVAKPGSEVVVDHKQISVASGKLLQGKSVSATAAGRVQVDGNLEADEDVDLISGLYAAVNGSVVSQNGNVNIEAAGNVDVAGNIAAQDVTFNGTKTTVAGDISGNDLAVKSADGTANADLKQTDGTIDVVSVAAANIEQTGGTLAATTIDNTGLLTQNGGTITADAVNGAFKQTEGSIAAKGDTMTFGSTVEQTQAEGKTATIGTADENVTIGGKLTQTSGTITANTLTLKDDAQQGLGTDAKIVADNLVLDNAGDVQLEAFQNDGGTFKANNEISKVAGTAKDVQILTGADIALGSLEATGGDVEISAANGKNITVEENAAVTARDAVDFLAQDGGDVTVKAGAELTAGSNLDLSTRTSPDVTGTGKVVVEDNVNLSAGGDGWGIRMDASGDVEFVGTAEAGVVNISAGGKVALDANSSIKATDADDASISIFANGEDGIHAAGELNAADAGIELGAPNGAVVATGKITTKALDVKAAGDVTVDNAENTLGTVSVVNEQTDPVTYETTVTAAGVVTIVDSGDALALGEIKAASLDVTAAGDVTQNDAATVTGATTVDAGSNAVTLDSADNDFGSVGATGGAVSIADKNAVALDAVSASSLDVTAGGDVTQNASATVTGATTVDAGSNAVTLDSADNDFSSVGATGGAVSITDKNAVALDGITATTLNVTAGGDVTQNDAATVTGATTVDAGSNAVALDNADNDFGSVGATGGAVSITDKNAVVLDGITATTLDVTAGGDVTQNTAATVTGATTVDAGSNAVTLDNTDNDFKGAVNANGANVTLTDANGILLGEVTATGTLGVEAKDGAITQTDDGKIVADAAATTLTAKDDITLGNAANDFQSVTANAKSVTLNDADDVTLTQVAATAGDAVVTAANDITVGGTVTAQTDVTLTADNGNIKLGGTVTAENGTATLTADNGAIVDDDTTISHGDKDTSPWATGTHSAHLTAQDAVLSAKSIGEATKPLDIAVDTLDATATDGAAYIWEKDGIEINGISAKTDAAVENLTGDITLSGTATATEGNLLLAAKEGNLKLGETASVSAGEAASLLAGTEIDQKGDVTAKSIDAQAFDATAGKITVASGIKAEATGGSVRYKANTVDNNGTIKASGNVSIDGNNTGSGVVEAGGAVVATGSIAGGTTVSAETFIFDGTSVGEAGSAVNLNASTIAIHATDEINIKNSKAATIGDGAGTGTDGAVTRVFLDGGTDTVGGTSSDGDAVSGVVSENANISIENAGTLTVNEAVKAAADDKNVTIATTAGDIDVNAEVVAGATATLDAAGKIRVKGDVTGADVDLDAGDFINLAAGKTVEATTGAVTADSVAGNVDVYGTVKADNGDITLTAAGDGKSVRVGSSTKPGVVEATEGSVVLTGGKSVQVQDNSKVTAGMDATLAGGEYVLVDTGAKVAAGKIASLTVGTATDKGEFVGILGEVSGETVDITAHTGAKLSGVPSVSSYSGKTADDAAGVFVTGGKITATGTANIVADGGDVVIEANTGDRTEVSGKTGVTLDATGSVDVNGAVVKAGEFTDEAAGTVKDGSNADLTITAGNAVEVKGGAQVGASGNATVNAKGDDGVTVMGADTKLVADKSLTVQATTGDGNVTVSGGAYVAARNTGTDDKTTVSSANGSVKVTGDGTAVESEKGLTITAKNGVTVEDNAKVGSNETVALSATGDDASVTVQSGAQVLAKDDVDIDATGEVLVDNATVAATGDVLVGDETARSGSFTARNGATVTADGNFSVYVSGDADVQKGTGDRTEVFGKTGVTLDATGAVDVDGAVVKAGEFTDEAAGTVKDGSNANLTITAGNGVTVQGGAQMGASGDANVEAKGDDGVTVTGADTKLVADKSLTVQATTGDGNVTVSGGAYVAARNTGTDDRTTVSSAKGSVTVTGNGTAVESEKTLTITAKNGVTVEDNAKIGSNQTAALSATGDDASVKVQTGAKVLADANVDIDATGAVTVDNATVAAKGDVLVGDETTRSDSFTAQNGATVTADGNVSVYVNGDAKVDNTTVKAGNFSVDTDGNVDEAAADYTVGNLTVKSGNGVTVQNGAQVGASGDATITAKSVEVNGSALAANGNLEATASDGNVTLESATVAAHGTATLKASADAGKITAKNSTVVAEKTATLEAGRDVKLEGTTKVGSDENVVVKAGKDVTVEANAQVLAAKKGTADNAISVTAISGDVTVAGEVVSAKDGVTVKAGSGIEVSGAVAANEGDVTLTAEGDDIKVKVSDTGTVTTQKGDVTATATAGLVDVSGTVKATQTDSSTKGKVTLVGNGTDDGDGVKVTGTVEGDLGVTLTADTKDVVVDGGTVKAGTFDASNPTTFAESAPLTIDAGNAVVVQNGAQVGASGIADVDSGAGGVTVTGKATDDTPTRLASNGDMTIDAEAGNVTIKGGSFVGGNSTVSVGMNKTGANGTSSLTVGDASDTSASQLAAKDDLTVKVTGAVTAQNNAKVASDTTTKLDGASVTVQTGAKVLAGANIDIDATGAVTVDSATVAATGADDGDTKAVDIQAGTTVIVNNGTVEATTGSVKVKSTGAGAIEVKGDSSVMAGNGSVTIENANGNVLIDEAKVTASEKVVIGKKPVGTAAVADVNGGVTIQGGANVTGEKGIEVYAKNDVRVNNATVKAGKFSLNGDSEPEIGSDDSANMAVNAGGNVEVTGGSKVGASGELVITASGDSGVSVSGSSKVVSNGDMKIAADGTKTEDDTTVGVGSVLVTGGGYIGSKHALEVTASKDVKVGAEADTTESQLVSEGNLTVKASGAILAQKSAKVASDATTKLEGASVTAKTGAKVLAGANVDIAATGAVMVNGAAVAANGADKTTGTGDTAVTTTAVDIQAGTTVTVQGGTVEAKSAGGSVVVKAGTGVAIEKGTQNATVKAGNDVTISTTSGDVTVGKTGTTLADKADASSITATAGKVAISANTVAGQSVTIRDAAKVTSGTETTVTAKGAVNVNDTATVEAGTSVTINSTAAGDVTIDTTKSVTAKNGSVAIENANGNVLIDKATVTASEKVVIGKKPEGTAAVADVNGGVTVQDGANVTGEKGVEVYAKNDVTVNNAIVKAGKFSLNGDSEPEIGSDDNANMAVNAGGNVEVTGGSKVGASGTMDIAAKGETGMTVSGSKVASKGNMTISATGTKTEGGNTVGAGSVSVTGGGYVGTHGTLGVTAAKDVTIGAESDTAASQFVSEGNLTVKASGAILAQKSAKVASDATTKLDGESVTAQSGAKVLAGANVDIDATGKVLVDNASVAAKGADGGDTKAVDIQADTTVTVNNGTVEAMDGSINVKSTGAGAIEVKGGSSLTAGNGSVTIDNDNGAVTILNATVEAKKSSATSTATAIIDVDATGGDVRIADASLGADSGVTVDATDAAATTEVVEGNVTIDNATVTARGGDVVVGTDEGARIGGSFTAQNGAAVTADAGSVKVYTAGDAKVDGGTTSVTATGGDAVIDANGNIEVTSATVKAGDTVKFVAPDGVSIEGTVDAGHRLDATGQNVGVADNGKITAPTVDANKLTTAGNVKATTINATVEQNNGLIEATAGSLTLNGDVHQNAGTIQASHLTLKNGDVIQAGDAAKIKTSELTFDNSKKIALISNNNEIDKISGNLSELDIADKDDLSLGQLSVSGALKVKTGGSTKVDGDVTAGSTADIDANRNVEFASGGKLSASTAKIKADANITQAGASVSVARGYVNEAHLNAAVQAGSTELTAGGNIGNGTYNYVTVGGGTVKASAGGDAAIASAGSENLRVSSVSGRNVSLYTAGKLITAGPVTSQSGNTTVTAKEFGGIAQSAFGSSLTVNNFNNGARPLLAIFETKGGNKTPKINNQPNDTIVFIDGRLAGGDIQVINKLGALEAFPVQTPELKSEQGVFGNPNFLHDELDVANPFAVGAIDFLLQDIPLLTLTSDFPMEVDKQVAANGLNPTTSYWFGQNPQTDSEKKEDVEEKKGEDASTDDSK